MPANTDHPVVKACQPIDSGVKIWRYMDLTKLISFMETRSLHFARADTFDDPFEGTWTTGNKEATERLIPRILADAESIPNPQVRYTAAELQKMFQDQTHHNRQCVYMNCWHAGETESAAMWKLYGTAAGAVVIQSTYQKLVHALPETICMDDIPAGTVYVGMVQYKDYTDGGDWIPGGNVMSPFICKRKEFEHEKEVRAFTWTVEGFNKKRQGSRNYMPQGIRAEVEIGEIIETIRVQPAAPVWVRQTIERLIAKYGWGLKVIPSQIDIDPMY